MAEGSEDTLVGELTSTSTTKDGTVWVITQDNGTSITLTLDDSAAVYNGTTAVLITGIKVGDRISVVVYDNVITEIYLVTAVSSATKITGTVLTVDTTDHVITMLTSTGKLVYIDADWCNAMIRASTGFSVSLSQIDEDDLLVAYGSYADSSNFKALTIILES